MEYKLMHGDCIELMKNIPDGSVDMILCDPPYGIDYQSMWRKKEERFDKIINDKKPFVDFVDQIPRVLSKSGGVAVH